MAKKDKDSKPAFRKAKREVRVLCRREREKEKRRQRLNRRREEKRFRDR